MSTRGATVGPVFVTRERVRFHLVDGRGALRPEAALLLAHRVLEAFVVARGMSWEGFFANPRWGVPFRRVEVRIFAPRPAGLEVEARLTLRGWGRSSLRSRVEFFSPAGRPVARVDWVNVFTDPRMRRKIPVPPEVRRALAEAP